MRTEHVVVMVFINKKKIYKVYHLMYEAVRWLTQLLVDYFFFTITILIFSWSWFMVMVLFVAAGHPTYFHVSCVFSQFGKKDNGRTSFKV